VVLACAEELKQTLALNGGMMPLIDSPFGVAFCAPKTWNKLVRGGAHGIRKRARYLRRGIAESSPSRSRIIGSACRTAMSVRCGRFRDFLRNAVIPSNLEYGQKNNGIATSKVSLREISGLGPTWATSRLNRKNERFQAVPKGLILSPTPTLRRMHNPMATLDNNRR